MNPSPIEIVRGAPDETELAALVTVLMAVARARAGGSPPSPPRSPPPWTSSGAAHRPAGGWAGRPHPAWRTVL
ncbi:acyl-CoA carboxylase epsilon subunit [Thermomonospora umbrina]|uniref:Acyl-CoA carboxylase epsilon subunit-like protein n=1 Tax=Thermomonospora umbrina TaxID=111806 RepID=A0A3D9SK46_9ACTN|nr:acyl-CoA carboxylase epsilon subunit [Thermomonospora umbrina]REE96269.1 acyl-CoA carboxylase epsilon subunit-like protein [Thermomonospora umbrina]